MGGESVVLDGHHDPTLKRSLLSEGGRGGVHHELGPRISRRARLRRRAPLPGSGPRKRREDGSSVEAHVEKPPDTGTAEQHRSWPYSQPPASR
jgi:hypothetical protein